MRKYELEIIIVIVIAGVVGGESICPIVECEKKMEDPSSSLCINWSNNKVWVRECPEKEKCSLPTIYIGEDAYCESGSNYNNQLAAGEPCIYGEECTTGACNTSSHLCYGFPHGMNCELSGECDLGLYCDGKCTYIPQINSSCTSTCSTYAICLDGTCIPKLSIPLGNIINEQPGSTTEYNMACSTAYATIKWEITPDVYHCEQSPKLEGYKGEIMYSATDTCDGCIYIDYEGENRTQAPICPCSLNGQGGLCLPQVSDNPQGLQHLKEYFAQGIECNLDAGPFCLRARNLNLHLWENAYLFYVYINYYPAYTINYQETCYQSLLLDHRKVNMNLFIQARKNNTGFSLFLWVGIAAGVLILLALAILLYFFLL